MSKMEYMPVDCLQVPKMLFQVEEFKNLSNTAKILYSLFLDRLKFAVQNGWVDHNGDLFVIYPKSEMKKDLNTTRYGVDQAVQELVKIGKLVRIVQNDGKANHFYINDIYEKLKEIADTGLTMLIVEQDVNRSLKSSDYAYVVLEGKIVMQGKSKELSVDEVNDAYFGINTFSH